VALASAYAIGDVAGVKHSLHRDWRDAPLFHGVFAAAITVAAVLVIMPSLPLGLVTTAVQALAGILLPTASVFLLLLCNDRAVLGPWVNPRWLNAVAVLVVGFLIELSTLLILSTLFPGLDLTVAAGALTATLGLAVISSILVGLKGPRTAQPFDGTPWERATWTMPSLELLGAARLGLARTVGLIALRGYLLLACALLVLKASELA
jgi:Natural resistance-associated macrophage protein